MSFKKLRYNLLVIGLVALICCYIGMNFLFAPAPLGINDGASQGEEDDDIIIDDNIKEDGNDEEPPADVEIPTDAIELIQYGLDIINSGNGYTSTISTTINNEAVGVTAIQYVDGKVSKGVNSKGEEVSVEENYYHSNASGPAAGMVANFFKGFYVNETAGTTQVAFTNDYDASAQTYNIANAYRNETVATADALSEFKILQGQGFPIKITKRNVNITQDNTRNKNVRIITVKVTDFSSLSDNFIDFFASTGQMKDINYSYLEIKFTINKNNGYITKIQRNETFTATAVNVPVLGSVGVTSNVSVTQSFQNMNKQIVLADSL